MSSNTVYVTGLPSSATQDDIMDFFTRIGNVAKVQMPADNTGAPVAVVFDKAEDAASAVSISGSDFQEDIPIHISAHAAPTVSVPATTAATASAAEDEAHRAEEDKADAEGEERHDRSRNDRAVGRGNPNNLTNKIVVSNIPPFTERKAVRELFAACGPIDDFAFMVQRHLAYIGFATAEAFEKALQLDGAECNGGKVKVERRPAGRPTSGNTGSDKPVSSEPKTIPNRIVVRHVPSDVTKEGLRAFFEADCGTPSDIYVKPESGIAFLAFKTEAETEKALTKTGQELGGRVVAIERRQVLVCRRCGKEGHKGAECRQPYCTDCRTVGHSERECPRRRGSGGGGDRRRRRSSSSSSDRDHRRRRRYSRSRSRSRSPPRRRRHSRSRSPPRRRRHSRSRSPPRGRR